MVDLLHLVQFLLMGEGVEDLVDLLCRQVQTEVLAEDLLGEVLLVLEQIIQDQLNKDILAELLLVLLHMELAVVAEQGMLVEIITQHHQMELVEMDYPFL
jgi:hypothetical protein